MAEKRKRDTAQKLKIFSKLFTGLSNVYGTYDPKSGSSSQIKAAVTNRVFIDHLVGRKPYGVYLLVKDRIRAIAIDFDTENRLTPMEFVAQAKHYGISSYIERSKSKGYHVWIFFEEKGVPAIKARLVVRHILEEIEQPDVEVFPKQDELSNKIQYGNFINAPLFGALVLQEKTVFVDPATFKMYADQWEFLESVKRISEKVLDDIIELNDLSIPETRHQPPQDNSNNGSSSRFTLPVCAQNMLREGVSQFQRVSCFRLAVHLKRMGLPYDITVAALKTWAVKNRPKDSKQVITEHEIIEQTSFAFNKEYRGYGCGSEAMMPFCRIDCPVHKLKTKT